MIKGLPGWYGANSSVSRAKGERSLWPEFRLPSPCATPDEAVIAIGKAPALLMGGRSHGSGLKTDHITIDTARLRRD
jgi:hypothetical protein